MADSPCYYYKITVLGNIDPDWSDWLGGLEIRTLRRQGLSQTVLTGIIPDQTALRGILIKIWDLNLEVAAVRRTLVKESRDIGGRQ